jgi:CubicO group peptidase (beta-lactamase class C family)
MVLHDQGSFRADGFCDERFLPLKRTFERNFEEGRELGASIAVTLHGETIVDLWGGFADRDRKRPWSHDTLAMVFSTTKVPTNLCIFMLIDQGKLDVDLPIQHYWPEFKGGGKEAITTKHVLLHSSGLPGLSAPVSTEDHTQWETVIKRLEAEPVWYEPGSRHTYHPITYGFLLGEVIRRITGKTPGTYLREQVCKPLGIDFHIGMPESELHRVADQHYAGSRLDEDPSDMAMRAKATFAGTQWWTRDLILAESPATNGHGNARSVARLGAILANRGELDGIRLLSKETIDECTREHANEYDEFIGDTISRNLGFGRSSFLFRMITPDTYGWGGYGGSQCQIDDRREVSFAYVPNNLTPEIENDQRNQALDDTLSEILETLE